MLCRSVHALRKHSKLNIRFRMSTPVLLVSGFLGAGKTTLMRRLIADGNARGLKLCVIVNEFGASDVDGHILKEANAELLQSITGGCACCAGQDDFQQTLLELARREAAEKPDVILVEASGLADPVILLDVLTAPDLLHALRIAALLCVADAARAAEYSAGAALWPLLNNQLRLADFVLVNKADLAAPSTLPALSERIHELAPHARLIPTQQCEMDFAELWERVCTTSALPSQGAVRPVPAHHAHSHTVFCPLPHPLERTCLEAALGTLPPTVWRAKGFVRLRGESDLFLVQYTGGGRSTPRFRLAPFYLPFGSEEPATGLVFIGAALDEIALLQAFRKGSNFLTVF